MFKTLPSNEGGMGSNPSWGVKIPHACHQKVRSNILTNSIKTLKKEKVYNMQTMSYYFINGLMYAQAYYVCMYEFWERMWGL